MTMLDRSFVRLLAIALSMSMLAAWLAACTGPRPQATVPEPLQPDAASRPAFTLAARGVQIYECRAGNGGTPPAWVFVAPEAELRDAAGRPAGTHGAGPFWRAADGSRIDGAITARADAPTAGAIPWLLLVARPRPGDGVFARVTHVQRVNTTGGVAPANGCDAGAVGSRVRVPYTADYHFFNSNERNPT